jgi:hypothetical protein
MLIQDLSSEKRKIFLSLVKKRVQPGSGSGIDFLHKRTWSYSVSNLNLIISRVNSPPLGAHEKSKKELQYPAACGGAVYS